MNRTSSLRKKAVHRREPTQLDVPLLDHCDDLFSKMIREAAKYRCVRCGGDFSAMPWQLQCSHFFSRRHAATRFDPNNADPLCHSCHLGAAGWEQRKQSEYLIYMQNKLGREGFAELRARSKQKVSLDEAKAIFLQQVEGGTLWDTAW